MNIKINFVTTVSCFWPYCSHISATIHIIHKFSCQSLTSDVLQIVELLVSSHGMVTLYLFESISHCVLTLIKVEAF